MELIVLQVGFVAARMDMKVWIVERSCTMSVGHYLRSGPDFLGCDFVVESLSVQKNTP